jgi:hypothetical protein
LPENLRRIVAWKLPIRQVALLFYQSEPSLAYRPEDFEAGAGLTSHVHLPLDLPWESGPGAVWDILERLMALPAALAPWGGVLHPPADPALLASVAALWREASPGWRLMIENVPGRDLLAHWPVISDLDLPVCLDVGHLMAHGQEKLLEAPGLAARVELVHCYAPGIVWNRHEHLSLKELSPGQGRTLRSILEMTAPGTPVLFEVFSESDLRGSLETFYALTREWGTAA